MNFVLSASYCSCGTVFYTGVGEAAKVSGDVNDCFFFMVNSYSDFPLSLLSPLVSSAVFLSSPEGFSLPKEKMLAYELYSSSVCFAGFMKLIGGVVFVISGVFS